MTWQPDYITTDELASYAKANATADADELAVAVTAASRSVDDHCHRQFGQSGTGSVRYYDAFWSPRRCAWVADTDDFFGTPAEVAVDDGSGTYTVLSAGPVLLPRNAAEDGLPYTRIAFTVLCRVARVDAVRATHQWGWAAVPAPVKQGALLQGSRILFRRDSPAGVAGSPDAGSEVRLLAKLDPDVAVTLRPYVRRQLRTGLWTSTL